MVRELPVDSWDRPTPSEISVHDLVEHVVVGNRFTAMLLAGIERHAAAASLAGYQLGEDPVVEVVESARQQSAAFAVTVPGQLVAGPRGDVTVEAFLRFRLVDLVVHAWDLLHAAQREEDLSSPVVADLVAVVEPHLDEMLAYGAYGAGPSGTLPSDASPQRRLLDWFGRRP